MAYNGTTDCPDDVCLAPVVINDLSCAAGAGLDQVSQINQDFFDLLNSRFDALSTAICCVAGTVGNFPPLDTPVEILNKQQDRSAGTWDSGSITVDLEALPGVSVPSGAVGAILRCANGINGNEDPGDAFAWLHISAAKNTGLLDTGGYESVLEAPTLVTYVDTNLTKSDNDSTNDANIAIDRVGNAVNIAYRAKIRYADSLGTDTGFARIYLVGFI